MFQLLKKQLEVLNLVYIKNATDTRINFRASVALKYNLPGLMYGSQSLQVNDAAF